MSIDGGFTEGIPKSITVDWSPTLNASSPTVVIQHNERISLAEDAAGWAEDFRKWLTWLSTGKRITQIDRDGTRTDVTEEKAELVREVLGVKEIPWFQEAANLPPVEGEVNKWLREDVHPGQKFEEFIEDRLRFTEWGRKHPTKKNDYPSYEVLRQILDETTRKVLQQEINGVPGTPMHEYMEAPREVRGCVPRAEDISGRINEQLLTLAEDAYGFDYNRYGRKPKPLLEKWLQRENERLGWLGLRIMTDVGQISVMSLPGRHVDPAMAQREQQIIQTKFRNTIVAYARNIDRGTIERIENSVAADVFRRIEDASRKVGFQLPRVLRDPRLHPDYMEDKRTTAEALSQLMGVAQRYRDAEEHAKKIMDNS